MTLVRKGMTRKHTKRRRLSCGDREDACELLSQGRTANALAEKYLLELLGRCTVVTLMPVIARWESPLSPTASFVPRLPSQERARECWYVPVVPSGYAKVGTAV